MTTKPSTEPHQEKHQKADKLVCACGRDLSNWVNCGEEEGLCKRCSDALRTDRSQREAVVPKATAAFFHSLLYDEFMLEKVKEDLEVFSHMRSVLLNDDEVNYHLDSMADSLECLTELIKKQRDMVFQLKIDPEDETPVEDILVHEHQRYENSFFEDE